MNEIPEESVHAADKARAVAAHTYHVFVSAQKQEQLPDDSICAVFGMSGLTTNNGSITGSTVLGGGINNETSSTTSSQLLYGAFQTLRNYGRLSRTMIEDAMIYESGSFAKYIQLWIRSLPPEQRSNHTVTLCKTNFEHIQWDAMKEEFYDRVVPIKKEDSDSGTSNANGEDCTTTTTITTTTTTTTTTFKPIQPLGDHRHFGIHAKATKVAKEFYQLFAYGFLFDLFSNDLNAELTTMDDTDSNLLFLKEYGLLFGIDCNELTWDQEITWDDDDDNDNETKNDNHNDNNNDNDNNNNKDKDNKTTSLLLSPSDWMIRTWNALFFAERLSITELENALVHGNLHNFFTRAVQLSLETGIIPGNDQPYAYMGYRYFHHVHNQFIIKPDNDNNINSNNNNNSNSDVNENETIKKDGKTIIIIEQLQSNQYKTNNEILAECDRCGTPMTELSPKCGNCRIAVYCSKECQRADWKRHKGLCDLYKS